eukprot:4217578-Amphidinium_carterae.1
MQMEVAMLDASIKARWWVCRVPTFSNPADAPSRMQRCSSPEGATPQGKLRQLTTCTSIENYRSYL